MGSKPNNQLPDPPQNDFGEGQNHVFQTNPERHTDLPKDIHARNLLDNLPDMVWLKDPDGVFLACNPMFERLMGVKEEALLGKTDYDFFAADLADFFRHNDRKAIRNRQPSVNEEWLTLAENGRRILVETTKTPLFDGEGTLLGVLGIAHDITERAKAREALHESEQRYQTLSEMTSDYAGSFYLDENGRLRPEWITGALTRITGYTLEEIDNMGGLIAIMHPEDQTQARQQMTGRLASQPFVDEYRIITKDGKIRWLRDHVRAELDPDTGQPIRFYTAARDITAQKQAEEKLQASQNLFASIIDSAMDAVVGLDKDQNIVLFNTAAEQVFGYAAADIIGQPHDLLLPERFHALHKKYIRQFSDTGETARKMNYLDTLWALRADGQEFPAEISISQVKTNEEILYIAIVRDITERQKAEDALRKSEDRYRRLFDTMLRGVVYQDAEGTIISMNPAAERILGKTMDEFLGKTSVSVEHDTLTEDGKPYAGQEHPSMVALRTGKPVQNVLMQVYNPREKRYRLISITAMPLFQAGENKPFQVYTIFDDITEQKQAEKALREQVELQRQLAQIAATVPGMICSFLQRPDGSVCMPYTSAALDDIYGLDAAELAEDATPLFEIMHPEDRQHVNETIAESARTMGQWHDEYRIQHPRKGEIWVEGRSVPQRQEDGSLLWHGFIQNITERKRIEQAIYLMSETQKQIANLDNLKAVYKLVGKQVQKLIGESYTVTSMYDEQIQSMRLVGLYGFGTRYEKLVRQFKIDPTRMTYALDDMTPAELQIFRSGRLEKFEDGLYALLTRKVPRRICDLAERQLHISDIYTMGFVWHDFHYGGLIILTKQDIAPYKKMIETIMNQAAIAIKRIRSEQALRESEEKLQLFIEHAPAALAMFDKEMRYLAASHRWLTDFHLEGQEIIGRCHYNVFPEISDHLKAIHQRGLAGEIMAVDEDKFVRADGRLQWLAWEMRPWYTAQKDIGGIVIFSEDITVRKETEGALGDLQDILATAESVAKMGSWKWDLETQKATWSDETFTLFGIDPETFDGDLNKALSTRVHPDDLTAVNQAMLAWLKDLTPKPLEYRIILPDGKERILWSEGQLTHNQAGQPVALVGYIQDITERKKTEKALRESEARYHRTLENMLEGCQIIDFDWRYLYVNASVVTHARRSKDSLLGWTMMEAYPGIENTELFAILRRCMNERIARRMENQFFYDDGSHAWFDLSIQPVPEGLFILSIDITERKQAEEALRQSEERFSKAFHLSPAALSLTRADGRILDINESYERLSGYSRADLIDQDATNLGLFTAAQRADLRHRLTAQGGILREAELTVRRKSGEMREVLYSVETIEIDGEDCALTLAFDITERKQTEIALQEMADNMATAQQMTHSGSWEVRLTPDLAFIDPQMWSDECYRILGVDPGSISITEEYFYNHVHPDDRATARAALRQAIHSGHEANYDYRLIRPNGSVRTLHDRVKVVVDEENGRPVKLVGIVQDITESKEAEATITRLNRRMELILNSAGEGLYGTDINGRITFVNPAMARMTGWEPGDLLGQEAHATFHHSSPDGSPHPATKCNILIAMHEKREYHTDEDFYWRKDGSSFPVDFTSTPIWEDDQVTGMVVVVKDITERKQAEAEQAQLEEQLRQAQKMESIGRLAGGVAHDFNNQLTVIQIYSDLIRERMASGDPLIPKVEQIRQAGERASGLTRQLLAFSRKQMLQPVVLNLNELVSNLKKMLGRLIGEDITFSAVLQPNLWSVKADPGQIEQVIMNLVVNARDAMPTGGMLTIETSNFIFDEWITNTHLDAPVGPCVILAVSDTGHGMDEETQKQIFEPFFTTKQPGQGTGLGLATVHGIIKQSGGSIFVYSEPDQGTTFKVCLPANENVAEQKDDTSLAAILQEGQETILLVEDEDALRELVRMTLEELGYTVLEAGNAGQALGLVEQYQASIDLLLTDVVMPNMSGRELAQELVTQRQGLKILFMSGYMDDAVVRHGLLTAEVNFLPKPFSRTVLAAKVREALEK